MRLLTLALALQISLSGCSSDTTPEKTASASTDDVADTIYTNGNIYTVNENQLWAEAVAILNREMKLSDYLFESHCDGFMVVKNNDIVFEVYPRMHQQEHHLCQSVSKTTVCGVVGQLIADGVINPKKSVDAYIPDVGSGFSGAQIQNLLDMNVALKFNEDFTDRAADIFEYEMINAWAPDRGGQQPGTLHYLKNIEHDPDFELDGVTQYLCPNTDMLGCIVESVTGENFPDFFQNNIYRHIGAEADAYFTVDAQDMTICSGGFVIRLRDLARYAQLFANMGLANNGVQVLPEHWIKDCLDTRKGTNYYLGENFHYHNQMTTDGTALCHLGVGGQMIYANTETKVVVVQFSTSSSPSNGDLDVGNALYNIAASINDILA